MKEQLRQLGFGRLAYHLYHAPLGAMRNCIREGGPFEQRRTASGRQTMEKAACRLPALQNTDGPALELHLLTGRRFWYQTIFCLWTFARQSGRRLAPVIYDDGTLAAEHCEPLARLFPSASFIKQRETITKLEHCLPASRYPALWERWQHYPNIRKIIDVHVGSTGWKLVLDSDLLFFHRPTLLMNWLADPDRPLHAVDIETSYGYSHPLLESLAGAPLSDRVNVGLTGLRSEDLDWEKLEFWIRRLMEREGPHYYLEQALIAMLVAGAACAVAPAMDYVTLPRLPEALQCQAIMHHYVAESKRWYFQYSWRRAMA